MSDGARALVLIALVAMAGCATLPAADDGEALRRRAEAAHAAGDDNARALYDRLTATPSARAEDWFRLGNLYAQDGELEAAAAAYREALAHDPELARARHNLGMTYLQLGVRAMLSARKELPEVDAEAAASMRWLACIMEMFMGFPDPQTCRSRTKKE